MSSQGNRKVDQEDFNSVVNSVVHRAGATFISHFLWLRFVPQEVAGLAIWLGDRIEIDDNEPQHGSVVIQEGTKRLKGLFPPSVIVEFSWTHDIDEEITKFNEQMTRLREPRLGSIQAGVLIKTMPKYQDVSP